MTRYNKGKRLKKDIQIGYYIGKVQQVLEKKGPIASHDRDNIINLGYNIIANSL